MASGTSSTLDALAAKAANIFNKHDQGYKIIPQHSTTYGPTFERRSRLRTSYTGRSHSHDSEDGFDRRAAARSRFRSLVTRPRPSRSTDSQNEDELASHMGSLSLRKVVSNTNNTPTLLQSMEPLLPQQHPQHNGCRDKDRNGNTTYSTQYSDEQQIPLDLSPTGSQTAIYAQDSPNKPPRIENTDAGAKPKGLLQSGATPQEELPVETEASHLHTHQDHTQAKGKPLTPVVELDADDQDDDKLIQDLEKSKLLIDSNQQMYEQVTHGLRMELDRQKHMNRELEEELISCEKENDSLRKENELLQEEMTKDRELRDLLTLDLRDKKELQSQKDSLANDLSAMGDTLKRQQKEASNALQEAKERIRDLERDLDSSNMQLSAQQRLADRLRDKMGRIRSSAAQVAGRVPRLERTASSLSLLSDREEVLMMDQQDDTQAHSDKEKLAEGKAPNRHELNDMKKMMSQLHWPKKSNFPTFSQYLGAITNTITTIKSQGVLPEVIALFLNNHLMASPLAAEYSVHAACHDGNTIEGILEALKGCDNSYFLSKEEQFSRLVIGASESAIGYMKRLETAFSKLMTHDPVHTTAKNRRVKEQFLLDCKSGVFPRGKQKSSSTTQILRR